MLSSRFFHSSDPGNAGVSKFPKLSVAEISKAYVYLLDQIDKVGSASLNYRQTASSLHRIATLTTDLKRELAWAPFHFEERGQSAAGIAQPLSRAVRTLNDASELLNAAEASEPDPTGAAFQTARHLTEISKTHWIRAAVIGTTDQVDKTLTHAWAQLHDLQVTAETNPALFRELAPFAIEEQRNAIAAVSDHLPQQPPLNGLSGTPTSPLETEIRLVQGEIEALHNGLETFPLNHGQMAWIEHLDGLFGHAAAASHHWSSAGDIVATL